MDAVTFTREYFRCPHCGKGEHSASHLGVGQPFGPWYCDECGGSFVGKREADGRIALELRDERKVTTVDVLVLQPQDKPVFFVVEGMRFEGLTVAQRLRAAAEKVAGQPITTAIDERDETEHKSFYYESHSCPTNWLKPVMVYHDGDPDPHGLIEFVGFVDSSTLPADESWGPNDRDRAIVALVESATQRLPIKSLT